ncbi:hypothetical protein [Pseudonocardia ailaonensis]
MTAPPTAKRKELVDGAGEAIVRSVGSHAAEGALAGSATGRAV